MAPSQTWSSDPTDKAGPRRLLRVFEQALPEAAANVFRGIIAGTLGRRKALPDHEQDIKWWINLRNIQFETGDGPVRQLVHLAGLSPAVQWAASHVGDDPVAVLDYCILRRFDPARNPVPASWHYDANILGLRTPMINTWFPLVDVGETAPGLTILTEPRRPAPMWQILCEAAGEGGMFDRQSREQAKFTSEEVEAAVAAEPGLEFTTPHVPAGGAITFDQDYLHGTQKFVPGMGPRESFEFRVASGRVAREHGLDKQLMLVPLS